LNLLSLEESIDNNLKENNTFMAQQKNKPRDRQIGKQPAEKKHLIDPKYKNTFWTIVTLVILLIFFIVNNTRETPESGPYPPGYQGTTHDAPKTEVDPAVDVKTEKE
jgi:hypothetical protein